MNNYGLRLAWRIFFIALSLCGIIVLCMLIFSRIQSLEAQTDPSIHFENLESYYQSQQFESMQTYLEEFHLWEDEYTKYWEVVDGYTYYKVCVNISEGDSLYRTYRNRLYQLYQNCEPENRALIKTFLALS